MGGTEELKQIIDTKSEDGLQLPDKFEDTFKNLGNKKKLVNSAKEGFATMDQKDKQAITDKTSTEIRSWGAMPKPGDIGYNAKIAVVYFHTALTNPTKKNPSLSDIQATYATLTKPTERETIDNIATIETIPAEDLDGEVGINTTPQKEKLISIPKKIVIAENGKVSTNNGTLSTATTINPELSASGPTIINQNENNEYTSENYENDRNIIFDVIRRNSGFKGTDEYSYNVTGSEEKGENYVKENYMMLANPDQIRKRVVVQNNLIMKNNFINHKEDHTIPVDKFMKTFLEKQDKLRTVYTTKKIINEPIEIQPTFQEGVVGKFVELSQNDKNFITEKLNKVIELEQETNDITITGKADATSPRSRGILSKQANDSISRLEANGFKRDLLNTIELIGGEKIDINELLKKTDNKNKLNQLWALNRALMQIDFLDSGQVDLLNNSLKFKIILDAQEVDGPNIGNEFTGGGINIDTKGNERIEKVKTTLPLKELNSPLLFFHININNTKNGILDLVYRDNNLKLEKSRDNKASVGLNYLDGLEDSHIANYSPAQYDFGNLTLNLTLSNEDIGLLQTKDVTGDMLTPQQKKLNQYENIKSYNEKSNNYFDDIKYDPEDFIKLLNVYKEKTNKLDEKTYIEGVIETIKGLNS